VIVLVIFHQRVVEICKLHKEKFENSSLVQLATRTKRRITYVVKNCELCMNELRTQIDLNILPLGSYDVLIGMDGLEKFKVVLDCYNKSFTCVHERGSIINIKGLSRPVNVEPSIMELALMKRGPIWSIVGMELVLELIQKESRRCQ
jgi:hypothetical protein